MAVNALEAQPALGLLRDFATATSGEHAGSIDLKVSGTRIFVDGARILALAQGLVQTNTAERLRVAGRQRKMPDAEVAALVDAFYYLQVLRLRHQRSEHDTASANRIVPAALNEMQRRVLKEALRLAKVLQTRIKLDYQL
jgi:CBS domain-containing protein